MITLIALAILAGCVAFLFGALVIHNQRMINLRADVDALMEWARGISDGDGVLPPD